MSQYSVVVILEVMDKSGKAMDKLLQELNNTGWLLCTGKHVLKEREAIFIIYIIYFYYLLYLFLFPFSTIRLFTTQKIIKKPRHILKAQLTS